MKTGLEFLPNPSGDGEGLSDAGIETFRDRPFAAVARETAQNSRDAREDGSKPVMLRFDIVTVRSEEFPAIATYREVAKICLDKSRDRRAEKEIGFFEQAVRALGEKELVILRIADFNTKGVRGPCEEGQPFHTLAKADGASDKYDVDSGGSFGIGKNAVFALSDIQTAFFSTRYRDHDGEKVLCMGKTHFISHKDKNGHERRRKGYWGKLSGYMPLEDASEIPGWLLRDEQGTSIFSICMRQHVTDWRYEMAAEIIINFFCAIERGEMEFEIDDASIKINRGTLQGLFRNEKVNNAVDQLKKRSKFDAAKAMHTCLVDENAIVQNLKVADLGRVTLRILMRDDIGYTVGILRNGMFITDNLGNFNESFKRFPLYREFVAIVEPEGRLESEWFKRLENPSHNDLSAERITDPDLRRKGQKAFTELAKKIRDAIKELARSEPATTVELDELNDFFASDEARQDDDAGTDVDPRSVKPTPVKKSPPRQRSKVHRGDGEKVDGTGTARKPHLESGAQSPEPPGAGSSPRPNRMREPVILEDERNALTDSRDHRKRRVFFTPPVSGDITITIEAAGLSAPDPIAIVGTDRGRIEKGALILSCTAGERMSVNVEFPEPYEGPIETLATASLVEEGGAA